MIIRSVMDETFKLYGQVLKGYDLKTLIILLEQKTPMPKTGFVYKTFDPVLESNPIFVDIKKRAFGSMPIQLGYCNGRNSKLNCLEYHKSSEVCIMANDTILLLGLQSDIVDWKYNTEKVQAFMVPAGTGVELYATTLHYAPCSAKHGQGYRVACCLPLSTNDDIELPQQVSGEDQLLFAKNKWLIAHAESDEAAKGAYVGLDGMNIDISGVS